MMAIEWEPGDVADAPKMLTLIATVECACGAPHTFSRLANGWEHQWTCSCGRVLSVQVPDFELQYAARRTIAGAS